MISIPSPRLPSRLNGRPQSAIPAMPPATTPAAHSSALCSTVTACASRSSRRAKRGEFVRRLAVNGVGAFLLVWLATWFGDDWDAGFAEPGHVAPQNDDSDGDGDGDVAVPGSIPQSPPRFILYRMIGNDIPPLQCDGQLYENTLYALQHEPRRLAGCRRVWVVNNVVNETSEQLVVRALKAHGYGDEDIIVRRINYSHVAQLPEDQWGAAVSAQNEARNAMLEHGQASGARWILPWDGNQFLTREAWHRIVAAADRYEAQGLTVFKVAMVKVQSVQQPAWLNASSLFRHIRPHAPGQWESQVAFRNDSPHRFKEAMPLLFISRGGAAFESQCRYSHSLLSALEVPKYYNTLLAPTSVTTTHGLALHLAVTTALSPSHHASSLSQLSHSSACLLYLMIIPMAVIGRDYHERRVSVRTALQCGYSVRLWYHPCPGVDIKKAFRSTAYRTELRARGREMFQEQIRVAMARHGVLPVMGKADGGEL
ncbi:unnamed protein product [Closterium sp. Naga37s-1]|nr:unnamed protein product [Closterium sp. Naga37s-1]